MMPVARTRKRPPRKVKRRSIIEPAPRDVVAKLSMLVEQIADLMQWRSRGTILIPMGKGWTMECAVRFRKDAEA